MYYFIYNDLPLINTFCKFDKQDTSCDAEETVLLKLHANMIENTWNYMLNTRPNCVKARECASTLHLETSKFLLNLIFALQIVIFNCSNLKENLLKILPEKVKCLFFLMWYFLFNVSFK